jgi:hypothetical protein
MLTATAYLGPYIVVPAGGLYTVVDRMTRKPAQFSDGNPAIFAIAKDAFTWGFCRIAWGIGQ